MSGGKADFDNAVAALLALGSDDERAAYRAELDKPPEQDEYGEEIIDNAVQDLLLPRLLEKLRDGEWVASGFGYESGQPTELHPRLWQRLLINVRLNSAYDSKAGVGYPSATGSFHSLGFRIANRSQATDALDTKDSTIADIVLMLERFDKILPLSDPKKVFFHKATEELGRPVPTAWLKQAWTKATLHPSRRQAGVKSN